MADEFPNFFVGIIQELKEFFFLCDLDNENEGNEFIAVVDLEAVNVIDEVDKVRVEKADKSTEANKLRFVNQSNAPIDVWCFYNLCLINQSKFLNILTSALIGPN